MVNSSNGPATKLLTQSLSYLTNVRIDQTGHQLVPKYLVVTLITVKDLNNDDPDGYHGRVPLVEPINSYYMVIYQKISISCPSTPGGTLGGTYK